jgi:hypothetical protein
MTSPSSYALPYPFPDGPVWAAVKHGVVMNMVYMNECADIANFSAFRYCSRGELAKQGKVLTGQVSGGHFVPRFIPSIESPALLRIKNQ